VEKWELALNGADTMRCGLAEEIAIVGRLGYDWLEIRDWKLEEFLEEHSVEELRELFSKANVKPLDINTIEPITLGPGEDRQRLEREATWRLRLAGAIGCKLVVAGCYGAPEDLSEQEGMQQVIDGLKLASDIAAEHNVMVAYEFLGARALPVHTISDTMEVLDILDRDNVGWLFDFYHFHVADPSLEALAQADMSRLLLVHINDAKDLPYEELAIPKNERLLPGDGVSATQDILGTLYRLGYRGPFAIELVNPEFLEYEPVEFAKIAKQKTLVILEKYFTS
jgi:2-keto-myo-inositol isomerase